MPRETGIRYHEDSGLPMIDQGGTLRVLAALPGRTSYASAPPWAGARPILPRDQWQETSLRGLRVPVADQGRTSSCVGQAAAAAFRRSWQLSGQTDRDFSPYWIYGLINRGKDAGAVLGDAVEAMQKHGVAVAGDPKEADLPTRLWYPQQLASLPSVRAKAKRFRVLESWHLQGGSVFDMIGSALTLGFAVVSGILIGQDFGTLDAEGVRAGSAPGDRWACPGSRRTEMVRAGNHG